MNSRKRISDGHYESTTRSLQNSKYSNNRYFNNYYRERDPSPKRVAHRSVSPEGSPRERYHQSSSYRNKERDREYNKKDKYSDKRTRDNRDLEYKNYAKKSKVRERSSSEEEHKDNDRFYDKSRYAERDSIRRGGPVDKERRFGDWKEMISKGSGKKYYYNERDKSSQWEKPDEWAEYDVSREYQSTRYREKDRGDRKSGRDDRYSNVRSRYHDKHSISRPRWQNESYPSTSSSHYKRDENADMDISPESTPTSEPSYASPTASSHTNNLNCNSNHDEVATSPNGHHSKSYLQNHHHSLSSANSAGGMANNRLHMSKSSSAAVSSPSAHQHYSSHRNRSLTPETNNDANSHHNTLSLRNSPSNNSISLPNHSVSRSDSSNQLISDGPPTPEMDLNSTNEHRRLDSTPGMHSLQNVMSSVTQTQNRLNILTPSLAKFFRPDLITHVTNWPAEALEKQAQKIAEEVYLHGDLECCRISAEIQCARSIVRVTEIAATIQTQRRLFLKEQIQEYHENSNSSSAITF